MRVYDAPCFIREEKNVEICNDVHIWTKKKERVSFSINWISIETDH